MSTPTPEETTVKLADLKEYPGNPRKHNEAQLEELRKSLKMFGQYRPLVLNSKREILAGNGMFRAMQGLGWTEGRALVMDSLTEVEEKKLVLADNQIARMGFTDYDAVDELLKSIGDYEIPGYDPETVQQLLASTEEALEEALEYGTLSQEDIDRVSSRGETYTLEGEPEEDEYLSTSETGGGSGPIPQHFTAQEEGGEGQGAAADSAGRPRARSGGGSWGSRRGHLRHDHSQPCPRYSSAGPYEEHRQGADRPGEVDT